MCTLIVGRDVLGEGTLILAANRDESPDRPADGPVVLRADPPIVGGRDRRAGGTWLALRGKRCAVAVLNRRPRGTGSPGGTVSPGGTGSPAGRAPSRGLLAISVAAAGTGHPAECAAAARLWLGGDPYAPCSLVVGGPEGTFVVNHREDDPTTVDAIAPGWHVITHEDLDDPGEPRTAALVRELAGWMPHSVDEGLERLAGLLARHAPDPARVCIHEGRMVTVSTAHVAWSREGMRYRHGEGPACRAVLEDHSHRLRDG